MVTTVAERDALVVRPEGAAVIGLSGHRVGFLAGNTEVRAHGEFGAYTIVPCDGHNGYVLTDALLRKSDLVKAWAAVSDAAAEGPHRLAHHWQPIMISLAALGGMAGALVAVV
ncbi:MAG TPA: hypothetical protein VII57_10245 [Dehalococcoidia bacterium]